MIPMYGTKFLCYVGDKSLCMIRRFYYPGTKKKSFNIIAAIKFYGKGHQFIYTKSCALNIVAAAVDTISTIVNTIIG
jgi:hypothetical protein